MAHHVRALATPAASMQAATQSASASIEVRSAPGAAAVAGQVHGEHGEAVVREVARLQCQTLWSMAAPWTNTTAGSAGSKAPPPV